MPNIVIPNTYLNTTGEGFHAVWKATRAMLAAGWTYKASADSFAKETTGNASLDLWSVGGFVNLATVGAQTGTAASVSVPFTQTGTSPVINLTGTPTVYFNLRIEITTGGTLLSGNARLRWSIDGGLTYTSNVPLNNGSPTISMGGFTANLSSGTYNLGDFYVMTNTVMTVTGLTGMTADSVNHALTIANAYNSALNGTYRIASFISATSVTIYNPCGFGVTTFPNGGNNATLTLAVTTITATGLVNMTPASVGHYIKISGATTAGNNGTFLITAYISSSSVQWTNAGGATDANNGSIRWQETFVNSPDPYQDLANGFITWTEKAGGLVADISTVLNGVATVTGLTGMTLSSVGHRITLSNCSNAANNGTWMIVGYVSATSVKIRNAAAVGSDGGSGGPHAIHWMERDPVQDVYPTAFAYTTVDHAIGAWLCLQGPSTLKIPISTSVPSPAFIRGENVIQAATGASGEFLGIVTDATGGTGYIVVAPRLNGSGAGPRGWDTSSVAAAGSGASVTPSATVIEYVREYVWWKNTLSNGHEYYQCIDQNLEGITGSLTGRFSTMASLTNCTPQIAPGGATGIPTANGFPTMGTLCCLGQGGAGVVTSNSINLAGAGGAITGMIQVIAANCIEDTNISQDGSWAQFVGCSSTNATSFVVSGFQRCDDTEDGDVDPYVCLAMTNVTAGTRVRTLTNTVGSVTDMAVTTYLAGGDSSPAWSPYVGFRRRGMPTGDAFQEFLGWCLASQSGSSLPVLGQQYWNPETVACTFANPPPRVREPIMVASPFVNQKMRKGTMRWMYVVGGGNMGESLDSKKWMQFSSTQTTSTCPVVFGPWDGVSIPSNG
jgi:hypothetical protein